MKNDAKKEKVNIRVTVAEKNKIIKDAEKLNMSLSDYSRAILLSPNKKIAKKIKKSVVGKHLARLGQISKRSAGSSSKFRK